MIFNRFPWFYIGFELCQTAPLPPAAFWVSTDSGVVRRPLFRLRTMSGGAELHLHDDLLLSARLLGLFMFFLDKQPIRSMFEIIKTSTSLYYLILIYKL